MIVNFEGKEVKLPDFLIVGAVKSGTTSLYFYLKQHPQIFMPKRKEPQFFSNMNADFRGKNAIWKYEDYVKLFVDAKDRQIIGEASSSYLYMYKNAIECIKSVYGEKYKDLKIIAILRNPVDRAFSNYLFLSSIKDKETLTFEEAINPQVIKNRITKVRWYDYIGYGMYYKQVKAYLEEFPYVKIFLHEDLKDSNGLIRDLIEFLGIDSNVEIDTNVKFSPSGVPVNTKGKILLNLLKKGNFIKHFIPQKYWLNIIGLRDNQLRKVLKKTEMDIVTREKLIDVFKNDIIELQKLINRDLSHWLAIKRI